MPTKNRTAAAVKLRSLKIDTPRVFLPLLPPARYKGAYGGRGSGKSHFFAELLIEDCLVERGMLAVSIREVQKSLKDSSKRLIETKLAQLGLGEADGFRVYEKEIQTPGDGVIIFMGMQDPESDELGFHVVRDTALSADFGVHEDMPYIRVSEANNGHTVTLLATLAHEMIHLRQHLTGDREYHGPRFRRMAARVCAVHGFDPKIF